MDDLTSVIINNENLIYSIINKYSNYYDIDDLYQVGVMGMIKAYNNYKDCYNTKFTNSKNFYNEAGKTVHGLVLTTLDVYELSPELFDGTPEVGKTVTVSGRKHVVSA